MIVLPDTLAEFLLLWYLAAAVVQCAALGYSAYLWHNRFRRNAFAETTPGLSLIICARNEAENLRRNLPKVLAQVYPGDWELVLVDDASTDQTPTLLRAFSEAYPERIRLARIAQKRGPGKKEALSLGLQTAVYEHIVVTDADCCPAGTEWLSGMSKALNADPDTEIVLGYGPLHKAQWRMLSEWPRVETLWTAALYFSFAEAGLPYMGVGRNLAFHKKAFARVGGFSAHAHLASGDDDLLVNSAARRGNTRIQLDPESFVYSDAPADFHSWLRQKRRHLSTGLHYSFLPQAYLTLIGGSQAFFYGMLVGLSLSGRFLLLIWSGYALRMLLLMIAWRGVLSRLRARELWWQMPFWDFAIACYYGTVAPWFLISKRKAVWKVV